MADNEPILSSFLPRYLRRQLADAAAEADEPGAWHIDGALLFVDVVGFTSQVDRLAAGGPQGVELANDLVEQSIGQLIEALDRDGGEIVVFAGDALFALWPRQAQETDDALAIQRAARSALNALSAATDDEFEQPQLRFALGAGSFTAHRLGGYQGRWHCLLSGAAFEQVGRISNFPLNNRLVASAEAVELAKGSLQVEQTAEQMLVVRDCPETLGSAVERADQFPIPAAVASKHVSEAVKRNLGQVEASWLAEIRRPTVIFLRLPGLIHDGQIDGERAQRATFKIQQLIAEHEGSTLQFVVDDKGPIFIVAFGLSAHVHEDDPSRAAITGLRIAESLAAEKIACGVGICTGRVYCGLIGNDSWVCYTLIGNTMNFAARLMQRADPGPLCDQLTKDLSESRVEFVGQGPVMIKGLEHPLPHFRIVAERQEPRRLATLSASASAIFGRDPELEILGSHVNALAAQGRGGVIAVIGEAGIGKSRLMEDVGRRAKKRGIKVLFATGSRSTSAQSRWTSALRELIRSHPEEDARRLAEDPFLQTFLGGQGATIPDVDDAERALRTRQALSGAIMGAAERVPLLLCVEDTHWMDSLSWSLILRLSQESARGSSGLMLVLTSREIEQSAPLDVMRQLSATGMQRLQLGPLPREDRARVAQAVIGADSLSERAVDWLADTSGGNPLFCKELAVAALDNGRLAIANGRADLTRQSSDNEVGARLPRTLQGLIASRLDRLQPGEQVCMRVAAVIGMGFSLPSLLAVHPDEEASVRKQLDRLCELGLIHVSDADPQDGYVFHHALMRDAAYDSLPFRRRRQLHAALAAWMATNPATSQPAQVATLAHHYERAEQWMEAFEARLRAGQFSLSNFANREAAMQFSAAREMRNQHKSLQTHAQAWAPELGLAEARHRMGDERASRRHIEDALRAFGEPVPSTPLGKTKAIVREVCLRAFSLPGRAPGHLRKSGRLRTVLRAYNLLPDIVYYDNDPLALAAVTLRFERLSRAEKKASSERSTALTWYAMLEGGLGLKRSRDRHLDEALSNAGQSGDQVVDAWVRLARGSELAQHGAWDAAEHWLRNALATCERIGDRTRGWNVMSALGHVLAYRGELRASAQVLADALRRNRDTDNPLFLAWGSSGYAGSLLRIGSPLDVDEVTRILGDARDTLSLRPDAAADLFNRGLLTLALDRKGLHDQAFDLARETVETALERAPLVWLQVSSYLGLLEVLLSTAERTGQYGDVIRLLKLTRHSVKKFARMIPIGKPVLALISGRIELLKGRREKARHQFNKGLKHAVEMAMPLEAGELHLALAETRAGPKSLAHLNRASAAFQQIGAQSRLQVALERRLASSQLSTQDTSIQDEKESH